MRTACLGRSSRSSPRPGWSRFSAQMPTRASGERRLCAVSASSMSLPPYRRRLGDGRRRVQMPLVQPKHPVHLGGNALVMGGDEGGGAFVADELEEFGEDDVGGRLVEIAGR